MTGTKFLDLHDEIVLTFVEYLSIRDISCLAKTNRRLYRILPKATRLSGPRITRERGPHWGHFHPETYFDGPIMKTRLKKIEMSIIWVDQTFGNRKGRVWLQLMRPDSKPQVILEREDIFPVCEHKETTVHRTLDKNHEFVSKCEPGDFIRFMKNVGGGGGHTLTIKGFEVLLLLV